MANVDDLRRYLKKDMVQNGDYIHFKDAGAILTKDFEDKKTGTKKTQDILEMEVLVNESMKPILYSPNMVTIGLLKEAWGKDTKTWVGETGRVSLVEQLSFGKLDTILVVKPATNLDKAARAAAAGVGSSSAAVPPTAQPGQPGQSDQTPISSSKVW